MTKVLQSARTALGNTVRAIEAFRTDGWQNPFTMIGTAQDKTTHTVFSPNFELPYAQKAAIYRYDPIGGRICSLPPREMTREWVTFSSDSKEKFEARCKKLGVRDNAYQGLLWSRTFGGALTVMGLKDGRAAERPLNLDTLKSIEYMSTLDSSQVSVEKRYTNPLSGKQGQPELFGIHDSEDGKTTIVHESRCVAWHGDLCPPGQRTAQSSWGDSILDRCFDGLRDFNSSHHSAAVIMTDFSQAVFKIDNLSGMLRSNTENNNLVLQRLELLNFCRSVLRAIPIDAAKEEFQRVSTPTSGLPDLLDRIGIYLSCITAIPYTLLLGESPAGLNATGQGDHRNFYNSMSADQEWNLRPKLEYIFFLIAMCSEYRLSSIMKNELVPFVFNPLWQPSEKDRAETQYLVAKHDDLAIRNGTLAPAETRTRYRAGGFALDITIDPTVKAGTETIDLAKQAKDDAKAKQTAAEAPPVDPTPDPVPNPNPAPTP